MVYRFLLYRRPSAPGATYRSNAFLAHVVPIFGAYRTSGLSTVSAFHGTLIALKICIAISDPTTCIVPGFRPFYAISTKVRGWCSERASMVNGAFYRAKVGLFGVGRPQEPA